MQMRCLKLLDAKKKIAPFFAVSINIRNIRLWKIFVFFSKTFFKVFVLTIPRRKFFIEIWMCFCILNRSVYRQIVIFVWSSVNNIGHIYITICASNNIAIPKYSTTTKMLIIRRSQRNLVLIKDFEIILHINFSELFTIKSEISGWFEGHYSRWLTSRFKKFQNDGNTFWPNELGDLDSLDS